MITAQSALLGFFNKIIAKTFAVRLRNVIGSIIDLIQSAYIEGRNILEGPLNINEIWSWANSFRKNFFF